MNTSHTVCQKSFTIKLIFFLKRKIIIACHFTCHSLRVVCFNLLGLKIFLCFHFILNWFESVYFSLSLIYNSKTLLFVVYLMYFSLGPQQQMHPPECCLKKGSQLFYFKPLRSQLWLQCLNKAFHIQALEQHSVRSSRQDWPTSPTPRPRTFTSLPVSIPFSQHTHAHTHIQKRPRVLVSTAEKVQSVQSCNVSI